MRMFLALSLLALVPTATLCAADAGAFLDTRGRLGAYQLTLNSRSTQPSSLPKDVWARTKYVRDPMYIPGKKAYDMADESVLVYVPDGYKPWKPHGLFIFLFEVINVCDCTIYLEGKRIYLFRLFQVP